MERSVGQWSWRLVSAILLATACRGEANAPPVASTIQIHLSASELEVGQVLQAEALVRDATGRIMDRAPVSWESDNSAVATVSGTGRVQAVGSGQVVLSAVSGSARSAATVRVLSVVSTIRLAVLDTVLVPNQTTRLTWEVFDDKGATLPERRPTVRSMMPQVVSVDAEGALLAHAVGLAVMQATVGGVVASLQLEVKAGLLVDARGGSIASTDGRAALVVPPGALTVPTPIRVEAEAALVPDVRFVPGTAFRVSSSRGVLSLAAEVRIQFAESAIPRGGGPQGLQLAELVGQHWIRVPGSIVDLQTATVHAQVSHFGLYGILSGEIPARLELTGGPSARGRVAGPLADAPTVRVTNEEGEPLPGVSVTFTVMGGGGLVGSPGATSVIVQTDQAGNATARWTLGPTPGANELKIAAGALQPITVASEGIAFLSVVAGHSHSCGIMHGGEAWCWGINAGGELGSFGPSSPTAAPVPVQWDVPFVSLAAMGGSHTCGLLADARVVCWGRGGHGSIGDGAGVDRGSPFPTKTTERFIAIAVGDLHSCALNRDGAAYCWGANYAGQLGDGTYEPRTVPTPVATTLRFVAISAGRTQTCAITVDGTAYCWGDWVSEGSPLPNERLVPAPIGGPKFTAITSGWNHNCGLTSTGEIWCWGANYAGQFGIGTTSVGHSGPVRAANGMRFLQIAAGERVTCGVAPDSTAWCWGSATVGVGDGTYDRQLLPVRVLSSLRFRQIAAADAVCAVAQDSSAYCWGFNEYGQLGDGSFGSRAEPSKVKFPP